MANTSGSSASCASPARRDSGDQLIEGSRRWISLVEHLRDGFVGWQAQRDLAIVDGGARLLARVERQDAAILAREHAGEFELADALGLQTVSNVGSVRLLDQKRLATGPIDQEDQVPL